MADLLCSSTLSILDNYSGIMNENDYMLLCENLKKIYESIDEKKDNNDDNDDNDDDNDDDNNDNDDDNNDDNCNNNDCMCFYYAFKPYNHINIYINAFKEQISQLFIRIKIHLYHIMYLGIDILFLLFLISPFITLLYVTYQCKENIVNYIYILLQVIYNIISYTYVTLLIVLLIISLIFSLVIIIDKIFNNVCVNTFLRFVNKEQYINN